MSDRVAESGGEGREATKVADVVELFKALAHPVRARIVRRLTEAPADVTELVGELGDVSQPLVSHHLKVLRDAHLVESTRVKRSNQYELVDDHVTSIFMDAWNHMEEHDDDCDH